MITQSDLHESNRVVAEMEDLPRYDFASLKAVESFGWRESAQKWRRIAAETFYTDFARCCFAQRVVMMCETFAAEKERGR